MEQSKAPAVGAHLGGVGNGSSIVPDRPGPVAEFWQAAKEGRLMLQRCQQCGHCWHPMSDVCAACQSFDTAWIESEGRGSLYSYTVVHHAVHPVVQAWVPYTLCLVELDEGPRVLSTIDPDRGAELSVGARVCLAFRQLQGGVQIPVFQLTTERIGGTL